MGVAKFTAPPIDTTISQQREKASESELPALYFFPAGEQPHTVYDKEPFAEEIITYIIE